MSARELATLATVCLVLAGAVLALRHDGFRDRGPRGLLLRYGAVAGMAAVLCAVMSVAEERGGPVLTVAIANGSMVFTPAVLWVALRRLNGRSRAAMGAALVLAGLVAVLAPVAGPVASSAARTIALAVVCLLGGLEAWTPPASRLAGAGAIRLAAVGYGLFCAARLLSVLWLGATAVSTDGAFDPVTMFVSVAAVAVLCVGVGRMAADLGRDGGAGHARIRDAATLRAWAHERLAAEGTVRLAVLSLPDLPLIRTAHGRARAAAVEDALCGAARDVAPEGVPSAAVAEGVVVVPVLTGDATAAKGAALRRRFEERTPHIAYEDLPEIAVRIVDARDAEVLEGVLSPRRSRSAGTGR